MKNTNADVIIIGAGITGLTIARELSRAGKKVFVLEARNRIGGRIHTIMDKGVTIETGAEFIHGDLETTINMLKEYNISYRKSGGEWWRVEDGEMKEEDDQVEHRNLLIKNLRSLKRDMTVDDFLNKFFKDEEYADFKLSMQKFVEGYDSADSSRASAFALRDELEGGDEHQHHVDGGYTKLLDAISRELSTRECFIHLSHVVKQVKWSKGKVEVETSDKGKYTAAQLVITVPLGVLADDKGEGTITFKPPLKEHIEAVRSMGFGNVIKVAFDMKEAFWKHPKIKKNLGSDLSKMGFLLSDAPLPTWWTQYPDKSRVLTGWLAGPSALAMKHTDNETIYKMAVNSLSYIFRLTYAEIEAEINSSHVMNWTAEPFTMGAYAYKTIHTKKALKVLVKPVERTVFFAGEALYEGVEMGTVEAALKNAFEVAGEVLK